MPWRWPFTRETAAADTGQQVTVTALGGGLEGAERTSRETMAWNADRRSPDQLINSAKPEADARGRDLVTNDGFAQGIVDINRDSIVGNQYRLNALPNWEVLSRLAAPSFDDVWAEEFQVAVEERFNLIADSNDCWLDAARQLTFTGQVRMAIAGFVYTGEVLATAEWIREVDRPFSTAVQTISPARLSNPDMQSDDANLRAGVRKDLRGKPQGYYIRLTYPTEYYPLSGADSFRWSYVLAAKPWGRRQVIHITDPIQPAQTRGLSALVAVLKQMRMTKKFQEVVLQNAVINASYAATIESELPSQVVAAAMGSVPQTDVNGAFMGFIGGWLESLQSYLSTANTVAIDGAKIPHLFPGTKLNTSTLGSPGGLGDQFEASLLRHIAAGLGISYEDLANDWTKTNYSSGRASMLKTWKHMAARKKFVADRFADEIYALWLEEDLNAGNLPLPRGWNSRVLYMPFGKEAVVECDWIGAARGQIDELKETQAALLRVKGGFSTREQEIAKQGDDWRKVFRQLAREKKLQDELGLVFDANPQKDGSTSGQTVMPDASNPDDSGQDTSGATGAEGLLPLTNGAISLDDLTHAFETAIMPLLTEPPPAPAPTPPAPEKRIERTRVTKHDAQGRILEFEREEVTGTGRTQVTHDAQGRILELEQAEAR